MADWQRRSVLKTGTVVLTGGLLSSVGTADPTPEEGEVPEEAEDPLEEADEIFEELTGWSSYSGNPGNVRFVPSPDGFTPPDTIAWQYERIGAAAAADGRVYLQTGGEIHALDAADGDVCWTSNEGRCRTTPAVGGGTVYATGDQLLALEADTGDVRWSTTLGTDVVGSAPLVAFETVYVVADGALHAFDASDGSPRWQHESLTVPYEPSRDAGPGHTSYAFNTSDNALAATNGAVWALLDDRASDEPVGTDAVAAFDPLTGETQWSAHLNPECYANGLAVTEETLFVENATEEGVMVFDRTTEEPGDVISDALVTAAASGRTVTRGQYTLAKYGAQAAWWQDGPHQYGPPTIVDDTVVVAHSVNGSGTRDEIVGFELESGAERWRFTFDERQWHDGFSVECVADGETVYVNRDGGLTALR